MHIAETQGRTIFSQIFSQILIFPLALSLGSSIIPSISSSRTQSTIQVSSKKIKHGFVFLYKPLAPLQSKWKVKLNGWLNWLKTFLFSSQYYISAQWTSPAPRISARSFTQASVWQSHPKKEKRSDVVKGSWVRLPPPSDSLGPCQLSRWAVFLTA